MNAQAAAINAIVVVKAVILLETAPCLILANADQLVLPQSAIDVARPAIWHAIARTNERNARRSRTDWTWTLCFLVFSVINFQ